MGMGTVSYLLRSLVESWSPDELSVLPGNRVEMNLESHPVHSSAFKSVTAPDLEAHI